MRLKVETRTPVWTGNAERQCDRLHETGLLGSLRWWFEVVVRGLGGRACDPTAKEGSGAGGGKGACTFDADKYEAARRKNQPPLASAKAAGLCPACLIFGTTGWRKLFRLDVDDSDLEVVMRSPNKELLLPSGRCHNSRAGGWYILPARYGTFTLAFHFRPGCMDEQYVLLFFATLRLMEHWTAIGAKETAGYGVFKITSEELDFELPEKSPFPESQEASGGESESAGLPGLTDFFFAKVTLRPKEDWWKKFKEVELALNNQLPCSGRGQTVMHEKQFREWLKEKCFPLSPIVRNWLRYTWYRRLKESIPISEELIFGTSRGNGRRTAIGISHAYQLENGLWEFRIWGQRPSGFEKKKWQKFVGRLYEAVKPLGNQAVSSTGSLSIWDSPEWKQTDKGDWHNEGGLFGGIVEPIVEPERFVWREFESDRDTVGKTSGQWEFFVSLVRGEERKDA